MFFKKFLIIMQIFPRKAENFEKIRKFLEIELPLFHKERDNFFLTATMNFLFIRNFVGNTISFQLVLLK